MKIKVFLIFKLDPYLISPSLKLTFKKSGIKNSGVLLITPISYIPGGKVNLFFLI